MKIQAFSKLILFGPPSADLLYTGASAGAGAGVPAVHQVVVVPQPPLPQLPSCAHPQQLQPALHLGFRGVLFNHKQ